MLEGIANAKKLVMSMIEIGRVKLVQVQRGALKVDESSPQSYYDPAPLLQVDRLRMDNDGIVGITEADEKLIDVHNSQHPNSRFLGTNGISIGFTGHYDLMRERFGEHITDGIAGENIIIEGNKAYALEELNTPIIFKSSRTGDEYTFDVIKPITPCREYSQFCANARIDGQELKETLQFLNEGRRGFKVRVVDDVQPIICAGDSVYLAE